MKDYENYIFDLYGTLVDIRTREEFSLVWEKLALFFGYYNAAYSPKELKNRYTEIIFQLEKEKQNKTIKKDDTHEAHPEIQIEEVFLQLFLEKGVAADNVLAVHTGQFFRILSTDYVCLYDGVVSLLEALRLRGKKIYLLSNAQQIFTEYEMHTLNIASYFDDILISSSCGVKKPDAAFFQMLIDKHQLDVSKSIMIGNDGTSDIAGAKKVGLDTFYIHSNISPKLLEKEVLEKDGTVHMHKIFPDADYIVDGMDMERVKKMLLNEK